MIPEDSESLWSSARDHIANLLDREGWYDVAVEIGCGSVWQGVSTNIPRSTTASIEATYRNVDVGFEDRTAVVRAVIAQDGAHDAAQQINGIEVQLRRKKEELIERNTLSNLKLLDGLIEILSSNTGK